jgi:hypothetical protein
MQFEWITSPLALYGALAAGLIGSLILFIALKVEITAVNCTRERAEQSLADRLCELEESMDTLREQMAQIVGERSSVMGSGLNLTKRTQALRMHGRGESIETIAAALKSPRGEIELLLKLQEILASHRAS